MTYSNGQLWVDGNTIDSFFVAFSFSFFIDNCGCYTEVSNEHKLHQTTFVRLYRSSAIGSFFEIYKLILGFEIV